MSTRFKLLILDADGTSTAPDRASLPSKAVIDAVREAQKSVHVALGTGRTFRGAQPLIKTLGLRGPSVLTGGAEIVDVSSGAILHNQLLSAKTLREVAAIALRFHHHVFTAGAEPSMPIDAPEQIKHSAAMLVVEGVNDDQIVNIMEEVEAVNGVAAHKANSWSGEHLADLHITHEQASKRHGAERLIELLKVSKNEVMAIGDSHNDLPLLQAAGFKVAMGGAPDELKAAADYVAPSFEEDGAAEAIRRFILADQG
ncbi:MAG TPA: HAD family hydrolase [Candidatus Saccharimonadia bacterium]